MAFTDLCGFTQVMKSSTRAAEALDSLYSAGFEALKEQVSPIRIDGLFISDCGILFARRTTETLTDVLSVMLSVLGRVHLNVFRRAFAVSSSLAYGQFSYDQRVEFPGISKNAIHGNAYLRAYRDNTCGSPKLYPNECRIVRDDIPGERSLFDAMSQSGIRTLRREEKHVYYDWMRTI